MSGNSILLSTSQPSNILKITCMYKKPGGEFGLTYEP